jgi:predicted ribosome quality control (RQC) complex YloA/Tae2 family protein
MATERAGESTEVEMISLHLEEALADALARTEKRLASIRRDLASLPDPEDLRNQGNLILARIGEIPRGAKKAQVTDFEGGQATIELDPSLTPQDNAAACYDRAGRAERAHGQLPHIVGAAEGEAASLRELLERTRAGEATVEEIREALPQLAVAAPAGEGKAQAPSLPYLTFRSSGGLEIRVGRGARRNDDLTFHHSSPDDVWLHARHASGAHVVLRWSRKEKPPARDLEEAAILAALHSRARGSGMVPVDWTRRKHVRKPRKSPVGTVILDRVKTLFVEPDPELPEKLREGP